MSTSSPGHFFYEQRDTVTRAAAKVILPIVLDPLTPQAVVDVGCGVGTWLSVCRERGVTHILGLERPEVPAELFVIPTEYVQRTRMSPPPALSTTFDLALCLEVAEHLPPNAADGLVTYLTQAAPAVLFSAAVPGQGGSDHLNEQWPSYWVQRFNERGYDTFDIIRPHIWNSKEIPVWYRQNLLLFVRQSWLAGRPAVAEALCQSVPQPLDLVHPDLFTYHRQYLRRRLQTLMRQPAVVCRKLLGRAAL